MADNNLKHQLLSSVEKRRRGERRAEKARKSGYVSGLSIFGSVGWTLIVPVLLGVILGNFLEKKYDMGGKIMLSLMFFGLAIGALNVTKEIKKQYSLGKIDEEVEEEK